MLRLVNLRLSSNPDAVVDETGKFNVTSDSRLYLMGEFENPENPFGGLVRRMIAQQFDSQGNPYWKVNLAGIRASVGKVVAGDIITKECESYEIGDRVVNTYTAVVFAHENVATVFRNAGHPLLTDQQVAIEDPAVSDGVADPMDTPAPAPKAQPKSAPKQPARR